MAKNLFTAKKAKAKTTKAKKDDKTVVTVKGEDFNEKLKRFNELKKLIANYTSESKTLEGDIKEIGIDKFIELYEKTKRNPGSFKLASDDGDKVMFIAADRYLKVDEERADELKEEWGEDVVEEDVTFSFNNKILNKHQDKISELIMDSDFLTDEEKEELIVPDKKINIKKGSINEAFTVGKANVLDFIGDIQPVVQLKQTR